MIEPITKGKVLVKELEEGYLQLGTMSRILPRKHFMSKLVKEENG